MGNAPYTCFEVKKENFKIPLLFHDVIIASFGWIRSKIETYLLTLMELMNRLIGQFPVLI
jgi:uncharacterized membrane protein YoaT (DUF817 family)